MIFVLVLSLGLVAEASSDDLVLVTDSLGRDMECLHATTKAFPGATLESMLDEVPNLQLERFQYILLLVGTNDLTAKSIWLWYKSRVRKNIKVNHLPMHSKTPVHRIVNDYKVLIRAIKAKNRLIKIMVSAILPRRFDYFINRGYLKNINKALKAMCRRYRRCEFIPGYKPFVRNRKLRKDFYRWDGLHLNDFTYLVSKS